MDANFMKTKSITKLEASRADFSVRPRVEQKDARNVVGRLRAIGHAMAAWNEGFALDRDKMGRPIRNDAV